MQRVFIRKEASNSCKYYGYITCIARSMCLCVRACACVRVRACACVRACAFVRARVQAFSQLWRQWTVVEKRSVNK